MTEKMPEKAVKVSEIVFYRTDDGCTRIECRFGDKTFWLTQALIAELFQVTPQNVTLHLKSIYAEGEVDEKATCKEFLQVRTEGGRRVERRLRYYSLPAILAVGYRVNSDRGTQFRQWATRTLSEFLVKGFVMDDERLKQGRNIGEDYFDELLERIRAIRASERRFYQKITDIYATSIDYDPNVEITQTFYATVQNKLHWAIHGHTAAEVIVERADASKPHMGLTTWKNSPRGRIRKADATIAKNYLSEKEISDLDRIVTMYLDYAELQADNRRPMHMADWIKRLDAFLQFNEKNILANPGKVSHELALEHAEAEFEKFDAARRSLEATQPVSDFDHVVEQVKQLGKGSAKPPNNRKKRK